MSILDKLLEDRGLTYDQLTPDEKKVVHFWAGEIQQSAVDVGKVRTYIADMRDAVELELENEPEFVRVFLWFKEPNPKHVFLKARLRNYRLLASFLDNPMRAQQAMERELGSVTPAMPLV